MPEEDVTSSSESDEDEYSETESAICGQVMTLSTPEENQHQEDNEREATLTVDNFLAKKSPVRQLRDIECESVVSDVSEIAGPLKDIENEVQIIEREELQRGNFSFLPGHNQKEIDRLPGETDSDYCKRARKINILSLAQEFAELKKINADALPFDLHKGREFVKESSPESDASSGIGVEEYLTESAMTSPADAKRDLMDGEGGKTKLTAKSRKHRVKDSGSNHRVKGGRSKRDSSPSVGSDMEKSGDFDVYNMESTLPQMDWETLEQQLQLAALEEKNRSQVREIHQSNVMLHANIYFRSSTKGVISVELLPLVGGMHMCCVAFKFQVIMVCQFVILELSPKWCIPLTDICTQGGQ